MRTATFVALALALGIAGCGSDDGTDDSPGPRDHTLPNGVHVGVGADGNPSLDVGGHLVFALADGAAPTAHRFEPIVSNQLFAMWQFDRFDEELFPLTKLERTEVVGDTFVLHLSGAGVTGTLTVASGDTADTSLLTLRVDGEFDSLSLPLRCDGEASFYGFGEQYNATDQRGESFDLFVTEQGIGRDPNLPPVGLNGGPHTTYFPMPFRLDARGFGALARTNYRTRVDLCQTDEAVAWFEVVSGEPLQLVVFHGPTPLDVIRQLGDEVGRPKAPPQWAYGLWIGSQGGRDAVLAEADALEAAGIPAKVLWVQDWTGQRENLDGGSGVQYRWVHDDTLYPNLPGMIADLKTRGYRFLGYANPFIDPNLDHFDEMAAEGLLIKNQSGEPYVHVAPNGSASHPDLTNPASAAYVQRYLSAMATDYGMDGWMADFGEWVPVDAVLSDGSDPVAYHNRFPVDWHTQSRAAMDEARPDGDWVVFARSGYTGVQRVSMVHWVGDQEASWSPNDGLPTVVPAMLNLGISGVPFVTHDIAGFSGGPSTKELFMRWTELGAFTPIMRTHEGNKKDENWSWEKDAETTAHFRRFALVHQALENDFLELAAVAADTGAPIVRHLLLVFPDDAESRGVSDQFMIGDRLLVAPVVEQGATSRRVYLPPGAWFHVWSGDRYEGGQAVEVPAPVGSPPVFALGEDRADLRQIQ